MTYDSLAEVLKAAEDEGFPVLDLAHHGEEIHSGESPEFRAYDMEIFVEEDTDHCEIWGWNPPDPTQHWVAECFQRPDPDEAAEDEARAAEELRQEESGRG